MSDIILKLAQNFLGFWLYSKYPSSTLQYRELDTDTQVYHNFFPKQRIFFIYFRMTLHIHLCQSVMYTSLTKNVLFNLCQLVKLPSGHVECCSSLFFISLHPQYNQNHRQFLFQNFGFDRVVLCIYFLHISKVWHKVKVKKNLHFF